MNSAALQGGDPPSVLRKSGPAKSSVVLFIIAVFTTVLLVIAGASYAVISSRSQTRDNNREWCTVLTLLTSVPVVRPADPGKDPSREGQYKLYTDFLELEHSFGCT